MPKFNTMIDVAFTVEHDCQSAEDIPAEIILAALEKRVRQLRDDAEFSRDAFGVCDTYEIEAEQQVIDSINRLNEHNLVIVRHKGLVAMMFPCTDCWYYSIVSETIDTRNPVQTFGSGSLEATYDKSLDRLLPILAQRAWEPQDRQTVPTWMTHPEMIREWLSWTEFQMRYATAKESGLDADDCHAYAGRNPSRAELWSHETVAA